jgi:DNA-directed RNA polymerase specialized sigma24 family protein
MAKLVIVMKRRELTAAKTIALRVVEEGSTDREAAAVAGVDQTTVGRWARQEGIQRRPAGPRQRVDDEAVIEAATTMSHREAAAALGVTKGAFWVLLADATAREAARHGASANNTDLVSARLNGASWAQLAEMAGQPLSTTRNRVLRAMGGVAGSPR